MQPISESLERGSSIPASKIPEYTTLWAWRSWSQSLASNSTNSSSGRSNSIDGSVFESACRNSTAKRPNEVTIDVQELNSEREPKRARFKILTKRPESDDENNLSERGGDEDVPLTDTETRRARTEPPYIELLSTCNSKYAVKDVPVGGTEFVIAPAHVTTNLETPSLVPERIETATTSEDFEDVALATNNDIVQDGEGTPMPNCSSDVARKAVK